MPKIEKTEKRTRRIHPVFSETEYNEVIDKAHELRMSPSAFVRMTSLDQNLPQPIIDRQLLSHISRIGSNLNQTAKHLNKGNTEITKRMVNVIMEAVNNTKEIRELILFGNPEVDDIETEHASKEEYTEEKCEGDQS